MSSATVNGGDGGSADVRNHTQASPLASQRDIGRGGVARLPNNLFPLGYKEGFSQWWAAVSPAVAEANVLSFLPFNNVPHPSLSTNHPNIASTASPPSADPHGPRVCQSTLVPLSGKDRYLNEFSVTRTAEEKKEDLVILHGYGAGLGFFYKNFDELSRRPGWKLWALDLLGYGRSSRPPFKIHATGKEEKIKEAEAWFVDSLEEWRVKRGIDKFTLIGHSLGGYLAVAYALKYPGRLKKLILASPVGIPEDPWAVAEKMPEKPAEESQELANEFLQAQNEMVGSVSENSKNPNASTPNLPPSTEAMTNPQLAIPQSLPHAHSAPTSPNASQTTLVNSTSAAPTSSPQKKDSKSGSKPPPRPRRPLPKWVTYLWEANISPFSLVRWSGPLGPRLVSGWTSRRFNSLPPEESSALHTYAYSLFRQRGSGEYALAYILAPGAYARSPLLWRVGGLGKLGLPTVLMYGDVDWMDVRGGYDAMDKIRSEGVRRDSEGWIGGPEWQGEHALRKDGGVKDGEQMGGEAKVLVVSRAGHHLYLDNAKEFNGMILKEIEDVERREERKKRWREKNEQKVEERNE